ncbi:MAG: riboflavin synthase [Bacteroides sp.]
MFSGIIEEIGTVRDIVREGGNVNLSLSCSFLNELKIDQSIAHNGVCLTVVDLQPTHYTVTAIEETLRKSNLGLLTVGSEVNLERSMKLDGRLDGHIVQGHVDQTARCTKVEPSEGSWLYSFEYAQQHNMITVEKGSITVNGVSLTVVNSHTDSFQVAIIPYTHEHTNFHTFKEGTVVNLEFDVIGKYVARYMEAFVRLPF